MKQQRPWDKQIKEATEGRLRENFSKMNKGKRILLKDGRTGLFDSYTGDYLGGDTTFKINFNGEIESVSIRDYDCVLIENENVKCPSCNSQYIMDGYLASGEQEHRIKFNEKTTYTSSMNYRPVECHACHDCGYIMLFAKPYKPLNS